jgi:hypothetical protein
MNANSATIASLRIARAFAALIAMASLVHADSLVVQYVQGPSPSTATPSTSISLQASCSYVGATGEQDESQLPGTPQYRWKVEYGSSGSITGSSPTIGASGWSDWGTTSQFTSTGTLNEAGPIDVTVTAEARLVDGNGTPVTTAISGDVTAEVDSAGLYAVDVLEDGAWHPVGTVFRCDPAGELVFRAIRWPLGSSWPSGTPTWTVDSSGAGSGSDLNLTAPGTAGNSKSVAVTDGTIGKSFTVTATTSYAGLGSIVARNYDWEDWSTYTLLNWLIDPNGEVTFKIIKDDSQKSWLTGYPSWSTSSTYQLGSGEQFTMEYRDLPKIWEMVTVTWGPGPEENFSFPFAHYNYGGDLQIICPVIPKGLSYLASASVYGIKPAYWGSSTSDISLTYENLTPFTFGSQNAYTGAWAHGDNVGDSILSVVTPYEPGDSEYPTNPSASKLVSVFDVKPLYLYLYYQPGPTVVSTLTDDTFYMPADPGVEMKLYPSYNGLPLSGFFIVRYGVRYYAPGSTTNPEWLYDRSRLESTVGTATIGDPGKYVFGVYYDKGTNGLCSLNGAELIDWIAVEAVGVDTLAVTCKNGATTLASHTVSGDEAEDLFLAWPSKDGTAATVDVTAKATATHDQWPSSQPVWSGCDSTTGTAGTESGKAISENTASIGSPGTTVVKAECGTKRESHILAIQIDVDASGVAEANEASSGLAIPLGSTTQVALTVSRSPTALDKGSIRVSCSSTSSAFTLYDDTTTRYPSTSFPGSTSSVTSQLGSGTSLGDALPGTIYVAPSGSAFSTTLTVEYLDPNGTVIDSDSLLIHTTE